VLLSARHSSIILLRYSPDYREGKFYEGRYVGPLL
jgi:Helix-turn-helix domain